MASGQARRGDQLLPVDRLVRRVRSSRAPAATAGRTLLFGCGVTVAIAAPLLRPDLQGWIALLVVSGLMLGALTLSLWLPWERLPRWTTLAFPLMVCVALFLLDELSPGLAAPLVGVLTLCAAYVGLTQRAGSILLLLPFSATAFVVCNEGWSRVITVRLVIATVIWCLLAELLARSTARQERLSDALRAAAQTDVLTGVGNRRELDLRLEVARPGDCVVICDLDHFKRLNDTQGHLAGDRVLADFGRLLRRELRREDFAGRFGGEEFVLLLPATDVEAALCLTTRLHRAWAGVTPDVTFSAGLAPCTPEQSSLAAVAAADRALYVAKAGGRNRDHVAEVSPAARPAAAGTARSDPPPAP